MSITNRRSRNRPTALTGATESSQPRRLHVRKRRWGPGQFLVEHEVDVGRRYRNPREFLHDQLLRGDVVLRAAREVRLAARRFKLARDRRVAVVVEVLRAAGSCVRRVECRWVREVAVGRRHERIDARARRRFGEKVDVVFRGEVTQANPQPDALRCRLPGVGLGRSAGNSVRCRDHQRLAFSMRFVD